MNFSVVISLYVRLIPGSYRSAQSTPLFRLSGTQISLLPLKYVAIPS